MKQKALFLVSFILLSFVFFRPVFVNGKLPIPADTIVGLYYPFRDFYSMDYPNGIPFKNFLITDPVRQQYPWRELSMSILKRMELPLWNPYSFSGTPLLANFQTAAFYPLNVLFLFLDFKIAWTVLVILQTFLASFFLFLFLSCFKLSRWAKLFGSVSYAFSGFSVAWMEWGTIGHLSIWLPLLLFSKEKLLINFSWKWILVFVFAECAAIFAGHLQIYFYFFLVSNIYLLVRIFQILSKKLRGLDLFKSMLRKYVFFIFLGILVLCLTSIQVVPTFQFISHSARNFDQGNITQPGWFIPWQHLIQFVIPDFFGNPTTLNYWGVWNYGEFIGFVGIIPLLFTVYALFFRHDKKTFFFGTIFFLSFVFSLPTFVAFLPYILKVPLLSTSQPTRLLFVTNFSLGILTALGFDNYYKSREKWRIFYPLFFIGFIITLIYLSTYFLNTNIFGLQENINVARRNSIFPTGIFLFSSFVLVVNLLTKNKKMPHILIGLLFFITIFDLFRFGEKFTPFTDKALLFPNTKTIDFLKNNLGNHRIMSVDSRIMPPNFSVIYRLQSIEGYDPLFLLRYGELIAALERGKPNISPPFGFNRIITPRNYESRIIDLLGVKYVLSLTDISSAKLKKVFQEGQTRVYENKDVLPRAFFVDSGRRVFLKEQAMKALYAHNFDPLRTAVVEDAMVVHFQSLSMGTVTISSYSENRVVLETNNNGNGFLVLTDTFYPSWKAKIDNISTKIYRTDYNFRGIFVSKGKHVVEFYATLF